MPFSLTSDGRSLTNLFNTTEQNSENLLTEKQNLLCVFKLVIKDLLNSSFRHERLLEKEYFPLKHFFIVFEHILLHGYTGRKSFPITPSSNRKDLWPLIELIARKSTDANVIEISLSSKEMTNIRTPLGRVRAWLRLALMQKRLADYFKILIEQKQELKEFYDNEALLLSDEISIISGLLVGLNVLDLNFCLKEATLDYPSETTIHYSLYLRERRVPSQSISNNIHPPGSIEDHIDELDDYSSLSSSPIILRTSTQTSDTTILSNSNDIVTFDDQRISNILDQKNYIEELHRNLQKTVTNLQKRIQTLEQTNKSLLEDTIVQKIRIGQLEEDLKKAKAEKEQMQLSYQSKIEALNADMAVERETYQKSRSGLDLIYNELQKKYEDECVSKQDVETEYQLQLAQKNDFIEATKVMEKDVEVKTTLYNHMKEQIDSIKAENIRLSERLQLELNRNDEREYQIQSLGKENQMLRETISQLESNIEQINSEKHALNDTNESLSRDLTRLDAEKTSIETDLRVEKDFRQRLQQALTSEKEKVSSLQFDIHELNLIKQEYDSYKKEMTRQQSDLQKKFQEQEETVKELALKLEVSIKREDEFREKDGLRLSTWMKDEDVKECCQCKKEFNPLRRKHHCRNCGQIFCETCASTKLPLPSSNKPVRVCDICRNHLLAQCAVNSPRHPLKRKSTNKRIKTIFIEQEMPMLRDDTPDFRDAFSLFDDRGDDKISKHLFGEVVRALGLNPTEGQIKSTTQNLKTDRISFEEFLPLYDSLAKKKDNSMGEEELIEGLKVFDKEQNGNISSAELRHLLTNLGERLTDEEVEQLLTGLEDKNGLIHYEEWIRKLLRN
ncbi:unnamed protein product [Rotaria sordida]|uniref:RUN and FYVE domain-containing protein 2 n=1 Tax=Rotaria sordida TaxID=392033 RepID=A0A814N2H1_9BILA|nr:unnamed protein product [Rotaria sordida]